MPLAAVPPEQDRRSGATAAGRALRELGSQLAEGMAFVRRTPRIAWSLIYLGIAASLIGVMGAIGPGFAKEILRLSEEDFFFIMGPAGLGAVLGILFLNAYGRNAPKRLVIDIGLIAMGVTLIGLAVVKPITLLLHPAAGPIEANLPSVLAPIVSLIAVVVVDRHHRRRRIRLRRHPVADRAPGGAAARRAWPDLRDPQHAALGRLLPAGHRRARDRGRREPRRCRVTASRS